MPIYEYKCLKCSNEFETLVLGSQDGISCPQCGGENVERLMSACAFKSGGDFTPSTGSSGCASCSSGSCSTCH